MPDITRQLVEILKIGHDTSMRGDGISLQQAIARTKYSDLRPRFDARDLLLLIKKHPSLIQEWTAYSEDKRTDGGWYLIGRAIGRVTPKTRRRYFRTCEDAVAHYVICELDFWADISKTG